MKALNQYQKNQSLNLSNQKDKKVIRSNLLAFRDFRFEQPMHISELIQFIIKSNIK